MMHLDRTPDSLKVADRLAGMARAAPEALAEAGFTKSDRFPLNRAALALRREAGLSQRALVEGERVPHNTLRKIEDGKWSRTGITSNASWPCWAMNSK